jgi:hypothetical protein
MTPLVCHYCARGIGTEDGANASTQPAARVPATVTLHDARGCLHVCVRHAVWRFRRSFVEGHSKGCPYLKG